MNVSADFRKFHDNLAELVGTQKTWFVHLKTVKEDTYGQSSEFPKAAEVLFKYLMQ